MHASDETAQRASSYLVRAYKPQEHSCAVVLHGSYTFVLLFSTPRLQCQPLFLTWQAEREEDALTLTKTARLKKARKVDKQRCVAK
jgi:hypothetical protein